MRKENKTIRLVCTDMQSLVLCMPWGRLEMCGCEYLAWLSMDMRLVDRRGLRGTDLERLGEV